ncbi:MAG: TM2 domain-containing protein [Clostridia bacterium]|nr:TM2 domain-containing protein [Clostridia bacterium]
MYCKNCGKEINENAAICVACGFAKGTGNSYCYNCGKAVTPGAQVCMNCGFSLNDAKSGNPNAQKSKLTAGLLGIFLGGLGVHNFYLGYTGKAIAQIILSLCFGVGAIWGLIEGIMILTGSISTDADGNPLKD